MNRLIKNIHLVFFLLCFSLLNAQETKRFSVYLIGDAGENTQPGAALLELKKQIESDPQSAVVFLGDNVYPAGLKKKDPNTILRINAQLNMLKDYKGAAYIIPGNHDWAAQTIKGKAVLLEQQNYVDSVCKTFSISNNNSGSFFPKNALPGPEAVLIAPGVRLVMIDTQWFLHAFKKNKSGSKKQTEKTFYFRLDSILLYAKQNNEQVIVAGHHPIYTNGEHSRKMQPLRFMINYVPPFQLFGAAGLYRLFSQDIDHHQYKKMRKELLAIFRKYDKVVYVCGHDHNMQLFVQENDTYIVSGAGSKLSKLRKKKRFESMWNDDSSTGFIRLDILENGSLNMRVFKTTEPKVLDLKGF
ncbi:MAG: metallophosphoesterase [Bacteroidia bacterium]|nr:metallophosphoesterase [Bacteroidia bacterium]